MIFIYLFIIGLPCMLVIFISKKVKRTRSIAMHGIKVDAVITQVILQHFSKGSYDKIMLEYKDHVHACYKASTSSKPGRYKVGDNIAAMYLPDKPADYIIGDVKEGYWILLLFSVLLLLFAVFAVYKINEMLVTGHYR